MIGEDPNAAGGGDGGGAVGAVSSAGGGGGLGGLGGINQLKSHLQDEAGHQNGASNHQDAELTEVILLQSS